MAEQRIYLEGALGTQSLDRTLLAQFAEVSTNSVSRDCLVIDMKRVDWMDLFPLAELVLLVYEAASKWSRVFVQLPATSAILPEERAPSVLSEGELQNYVKRRRVRAFLERWGFEHLIATDPMLATVSKEDGKRDYEPWQRANDNPLSDVLELTPCLDHAGLRKIEGTLDRQESVAKVFEQWAGLDIVSSHDLARVIVRELGQNVIEHASLDHISPERIRSFMALRLVKPIDSVVMSHTAASQLLTKRIEQALDCERRYLSQGPAREGYLEVVVVDNGSGVANTLRPAFSNEFGREPASDSEVLRWAFYEHSSRTPEKRLAQESPTGLHWVAERVVRNRGFIRLRSGASDISFAGNGALAAEGVTRDNLASISGSQFHIILPLSDSAPKPHRTLWFPEPQAKERLRRSERAEVLSLGPQLNRLRRQSRDDDLALTELSRSVDAAANRLHAQAPLCLALDFRGPPWTKEEMEQILRPIVRRRWLIAAPVVGVNFDPGDLTVLSTTRAFAMLCEDDIAFPLALKDSTITWPGITEQSVLVGLDMLFKEVEIRIDDLERSIASQGGDPAKFHDMAAKNPQLIRYDHEGHTIRIGVNRHTLSLTSNLADEQWWRNQTEVLAVIAGRFEYPASGYFSDRFVEGKRLLHDPDSRAEIADALRSWTSRFGSLDCFITCTDTGVEIANLAQDVIGIRYTYFRNPRHGADERPSRPVIPGAGYAIVTDVIGNGTTASLLVEYLKRNQATPLGIFALVDTAPTGTEQILGVPITSIVHYPTRKLKRRPAEWGSGPTQVIDESGSLRASETSVRIEQVVPEASVDRFWVHVRRTGAVLAGHWAHGPLHHVFYIRADRFLMDDQFTRQLFTALVLKLGEDPDLIMMPRHPETLAIEHIIRDNFNQVLIMVPRSESEFGLTRYNLSGTYGQTKSGGQGDIQGKHVLIIDSGTITGSTLAQLRNIAIRYGARRVSMFVLFQRLSPADVSTLIYSAGDPAPELVLYCAQQLTSHPFGPLQCPACRRLRQIKEVKGHARSPEGLAGLEELESRYKERSTSALLSVNARKITRRHHDVIQTSMFELLPETTVSEFDALISACIEQVSQVGLDRFISDVMAAAEPQTAYACLNAIKWQKTSTIRSMSRDRISVVVDTCRALIESSEDVGISDLDSVCDAWSRSDPRSFIESIPSLLWRMHVLPEIFAPLLIAIWSVVEEDPDQAPLVAHRFATVLEAIDSDIAVQSASKLWPVKHLVWELRQDLWHIVPPSEDELPVATLRPLYQMLLSFPSPVHLPLPNAINELRHALQNILTSVQDNRAPSPEIQAMVIDAIDQWTRFNSPLWDQLSKLQVLASKLFQFGDREPVSYFANPGADEAFYQDILSFRAGLMTIYAPSVREWRPDALHNVLGILDRIWSRAFAPDSTLVQALMHYYPNLSAAVEQDVNRARHSLAEYGVTLDVTLPADPMIVLVDDGDLSGLLGNIVDNVKKHVCHYSPAPGKTVGIEVREAPAGEGLVELLYTDDGDRTVPPATKDQLFVRGHKWHEVSTRLRRYGAVVEPIARSAGFAVRVIFRGPGE